LPLATIEHFKRFEFTSNPGKMQAGTRPGTDSQDTRGPVWET